MTDVRKNMFHPGTILHFHHVHTGEVETFRVLRAVELEKKLLYALEVKGTRRPMLLLWHGHDGCYRLLMMTSNSERKAWGKLVKHTDGSYVDCSRHYEYNERLRCLGSTKPKLIKYAAWKEVLSHLPEQMQRDITRIERNAKLISHDGA